ncbi:hypothetical protein GDO86_011841, partial [Hymenochirus boettgeri]
SPDSPPSVRKMLRQRLPWTPLPGYLSMAMLVITTGIPGCRAFNLDVQAVTVYSGPPGSYFGYSVDFYLPDPRTSSVLIGAPKANTSQPEIVEGGAVYYCPFPATQTAGCKQIPFDTT